MKPEHFLRLSKGTIILVISGIIGAYCQASPQIDEEGPADGMTSDGVQLPAWEEGACQESFDVRIWPEQVVLWLELENLRDLIADPDLPDEEKASLKRILAMQKAWKISS